MHPIYAKYRIAKEQGIIDYISENIVDGEVPDKHGNTYAFLATNGSWQTKYISLYEVLHDKYVAKYFAKLLLDKYLDSYEIQIAEINSGNYPPAELHDRLYQCAGFTKIVTVTISSQLIGVALRNLIRDDSSYWFLRNRLEANKLKSCPTLLRLSSYYSFDEEKPFREIKATDKVIMLNDVISTGKLVYGMIGKLNRRGAKVNAVFSVTDSRVPQANRLSNTEFIESEYIFGKEENLFFTLAEFYGNNYEIRKFKRPYKGTSKLKRINPLLNTIVDLETRHSEDKKILFTDAAQLLRPGIIDERHFKVGHFRQNLSHNAYLTDMHYVFSTDGKNSPGESLLNAIKEKLDSYLSTESPFFQVLHSTLNNLHWIQSTSFVNENIRVAASTLKSLLKESKEITKDQPFYRPDYIFYPPFSGIEQLDEELLHKCFGTPQENIICLQRFDTNKGWRFPFPSKWYNFLTKDKSVLILDSGSLTGESLVQLTDSITFLDVKEIIVLCVIARIEDFYREFYSRLKSIKVKTLQTDGSLTLEQKAQQPEHIVPLTILFGTNLSIPVYPSRSSCPFCEELRELGHYEEKAIATDSSDRTKQYIKNRQIELQEINLEGLEHFEIPYYLPRVKESPDKIDSLQIFLMRDRLGRIDSYRFYKDFFYYFDDLKVNVDQHGLFAEPNRKEVELILIIILHEPKLLRTISDLLIDIREICERLVQYIIESPNGSAEIDELYYDWNQYAMQRLYVTLFPQKFNDIKTWKKLFEFSTDNKQALNYLSFLLWEGYLGSSKILNNHDYVSIISFFSDELDNPSPNSPALYHNSDFRKIIKGITNKFHNTTVKSLNDAFFNLRIFFFGQTSSNTHNEFVKSLSKMESIVKNEEKTDEDLPDLFNLIASISNYLFQGILDNLNYIKNNQQIKKFHQLQYENLFGKDGVLKELISILKMTDDVLQCRQAIINKNDYDRLTDLYGAINQFYINYLHESSNFNHYCKEYKADFLTVISSVFSKNGKITKANTLGKTIIIGDTMIADAESFPGKGVIKKAIVENNNLSEDATVYLSITKSLLELVLDEIFINAIRHSNGNERLLRFNILLEKKEGIVRIQFIQHITRKNASSPQMVKEILEEFCGKNNVHFIDEPSKYIIDVTFNTEPLKF